MLNIAHILDKYGSNSIFRHYFLNQMKKLIFRLYLVFFLTYYTKIFQSENYKEHILYPFFQPKFEYFGGKLSAFFILL